MEHGSVHLNSPGNVDKCNFGVDNNDLKRRRTSSTTQSNGLQSEGQPQQTTSQPTVGMRKVHRRFKVFAGLILTVTAAANILLLTLSRQHDNNTSCDCPSEPEIRALPRVHHRTHGHAAGNASIHLYSPRYPYLNNGISCEKLASSDRREIGKAEYAMLISPKQMLMDETYQHTTQDCRQYIYSRGYIVDPVSVDEEDFPIAFGIVAYKHLEQVERLLRAVWRPSNVYCISIDAKSDVEFVKGLTSIAKCFDNVFVHPERVNVKWATYTVLLPELLCMDLLWKSEKPWKYFINLTGQEFPLKTNYELVQILKAYNGANDINGTYRYAEPERWVNAGDPPFHMQPRKGAVHIVACRGYVDYALHNEVAIALLKWVRKTFVPDEAFFAMLNFNPHLQVPGAYTGDVDDDKRIYLGRYKLWYPFQKCSGRIARNICIMEIGDLPELVRIPHLFVNKFLYDHHTVAYDCLELWYRHKVDLERQGKLDFDTTFYKNRHIVTHHF